MIWTPFFKVALHSLWPGGCQLDVSKSILSYYPTLFLERFVFQATKSIDWAMNEWRILSLVSVSFVGILYWSIMMINPCSAIEKQRPLLFAIGGGKCKDETWQANDVDNFITTIIVIFLFSAVIAFIWSFLHFYCGESSKICSNESLDINSEFI